MCNYSLLAKHSKGVIRWCHDCQSFHLTFNNFVISFTYKGFGQFKENVAKCYAHHTARSCDRDCRHIYFDTYMNSIQLLFSINEVGELLALIQEAQLQHITLEDLEGLNFN